VNQESLKKLAGASNAEEVQRAMKALCEPFGGLKTIWFFPDRRRRQYVCYVGLNSPSLHQALIEMFGGVICGESVAFRIPFRQAENRAGIRTRPPISFEAQ